MIRKYQSARHEESAKGIQIRFDARVLILLIFVLTAFIHGKVHAAGGDFVSPFPVGDIKAGKQEATAAVVDTDGNVIVTGYQNLNNDTNDTYYTVKFKSDGSGPAWPAATYFKNPGLNRATAVAVDSNKDIIVTGIIWNGSSKDVHTIKYNGATGAVMWEATFDGGPNADDYATCIAVDSLNNIYVGGYTNAAGNDDYFIIAYSSSGASSDGKPMWKVSYNGTANSTDKLTSIVAGTGGIAVTGYSHNGTSFDMLTVKYNYTGAKLPNCEWRHPAPGLHDAWGQFVKMDAAGNVIVTGFASDGTEKNIYTAKYNAATGALIWEKSYNGGTGLDAEPGGLYVDAAGDTYVTGYVATLTEGTNFYTVKYHDPPSGTTPVIKWEQPFNSAADNADAATGIVGDSAGNIYVTGSTFANGNYDFQTVKYKGDDGTLLWRKNYNGSSNKNDKPVGIGISALNGALAGEEVFVAGWSEQTVANDYDFFVVRHDAGALNPPSNLTAGVITKDGSGKYSIPLSWTDNSSNEDGFILERKVGEFGTYQEVVISTPPDVTAMAPDTTSFTDTGLDENKYYYYRVKAFNAANGNSHYSNEVRVLTLLVAPIAPVWSYLYNGRFNSDDFATAIAAGPDNHPVITGYSLDFAPGYSNGSTSTDYYTVKLDKDTKAVIWSDQHDGGFNQEDDATGIIVDSSNEVVVTGNSFQYPGSGDNINSVYTLKYGSTAPATILWKGQYNGPAKLDDRATAVASAMDGSKNIVVVGHGKRTSTNSDIYVIKYAPSPAIDGFGNAQPLWSATPYDGGGNDYPSAVAFDNDGNVFVTGYTETAAGSGIYNSFTAKYCGVTGLSSCAGQAQGEIIWSHVYGGNGDNQAKSLAVDNDGNVYVAGYGVNPGNGRDFLTIKYDGKAIPTGQRVIWTKTSNGAANGDDGAVAVKVDPIDNNAVVAGTVLTTACVGEPSFCDNDFRIIRYAPNGDEVWNITYLRPSNDDHLNAMALDVSGNIFVVGHTSNGASADSMSAKYSYDGNLIGATVFNGAANDFDEATAVTVNSLGDAFVAGYSRNSSGNDDYLAYKVAGVALQAPSPFTATPNYTSAILAWADNSAVEDGFHLERKVGACDSASPWVPLPVSPLSANSTTYTDTGLTIGQEYCYRVRAFKNSGEVTRWIERSALMQIPPPPGSFTAVAADTTTVNLSWTDTTTNETGFEIQRCEGPSCDFTTLDSGFPKYAGADAVSYSDVSACAGKTYRYRILSYKTNSAGTGNEWESPFTTLATPVVTPSPNVPGGIGISALNESQIKLTWTYPGNDLTGFRIYECTAADCSTTTLAGTAAASATSFIQYGLAPNSTHKYQVRAFKTAPLSCNGEWESSPAGPVSSTTVNTAPTLTATKVNTTWIDLSWSDTTAAETGFELQKCTGGSCTLDTDFTTLTTTGQGVTTYSDTAVCQGITNKYRVRAINDGLSFRGTVTGTWAKRAPITIDSNTFQPFFQTKVTITKANYPEMRGDYADIRFYDDTAKTELPFWIDPNLTTASTATVWVKTGPYNNIYLYYGNPDASSASNGATTFEFFDDFTGTTLGSQWSKDIHGAATVTVAGGVVTLDGTANADKASYLTISKGMTPPYQVEARINNTSAYLGQGFIRNRLLTSGVTVDTGIFDVGESKLQAYYNSSTNKQVPADQYVRVRGAHTGGSTNTWSIYKEDGTQIYSVTYTGTPSAIDFSEGDGGGGNGKIGIDWVFARKYTATEPSVSVGTPVDWGTVFSNTWTGPWSAPLATSTTDAAAVPTLVTAARVSEAEIKITWKNNTTDETGIYIDRCTVSNCSTIENTLTVGPGIQLVSDNTGLAPDTTYYYRVHAYRTATCGWDTKDITPSVTIVSATTTLIGPAISPSATPAITTACNDIRFTDSDGTTVLNHWVESGCNTNNTKLHVKVPTIPTGGKTIYLYYGNPPAADIGNGAATFDFFDDFTGTTVDASKWTITDGTGFTVAGGYLHGTNTTGRLTSKLTLAAGQNVQTKVKVTSLPANGVTTLSSYLSSSSAIGWLNHPGFLYYYKNGSWVQNPTTPPTGSTQSDWMIYTLVVKDSSTVNPQIFDADVNATYWNPGDIANNAVGRNIILGKRIDDGYAGQGYAADWDWVRIRKYANPAPAFSLLGPEETGSYGLTGGTWSVRRPLTITHTGSAVTDYQVTTYIDTTSLASDQISISWTPKTATETRYIVERCTGAGCSPTSFTTNDTFYAPAASSSYTDRTVAGGTKYCYRVSAGRQTAPTWTIVASGVVCATTSTLPVAPTLSVTAHETSMDLSWNDVASGENAYTVQRCTGTCDPTTSPDLTVPLAPDTLTYTDSTVCSNTYTYAVKAVKYGPNAWDSGFSTPVTKTTVAPVAPVLVSATRFSESQINLVWQDNTGDETGFEIDRCEAPCDFTTKTTLLAPANATSYSDVGLKPNTTYRYQVRAYKTGGACGWPSAYSVDIRQDITTVAAPTGLTGTAPNTTQVNLSWTDTTTAEAGFVIQRCSGEGCSNFADISAALGINAATYSDISVCADSVYNYQVKAINALTLSNGGAGCWLSKVPLTITNFQPNFLTRVVVTYDPDMQSDYRDLRFVDTVAKVELPYWIESSSAGSAIVWFKTGVNNSIYLYYGNSGATSNSSQIAIFGTGLVGCWPFNEPAGTYTGTTADLSGQGNDLALTGFDASHGIIGGGVFGGNALSLSGGNGMYAKRDNPTNLPTGAVSSVEAWVYPTGYPNASYNGIVSWGLRQCDAKGYAFGMHGQGRPELATWCNDAIYTSGPTATINAWNHVAVVQNGSTVALWLNGQPVNTPMSNGLTPTLSSVNLAIGSLDYPGRHFQGYIAGVRVYNRALTDPEIASRYASSIPSVSVGTKQQPAGGCASYQYDGPFSATATVVTPAVGGNIIPLNADFSNGLTSWTPWGTGVTADSTVFSGMKSLKVSALMPTGSQSAGVTQPLNNADVVPGRSYKLYVNIKANLDKTATSTALAFCRLDNSGSGNPDTLGREIHILANDAWNDNAWHHMTPLDITLKPGITSATVMCGIWTADGQNKTHTAYFNGLQLVPNPTIALTATAVSEAQINLAWKDSIPDETGYRVERCDLATCNDGDFNPIATGLPANTINFNDVVPAPGVPYTYRVKALKTGACGWPVTSDTATVTPGISTPTGLTATPANTTQINLAWNYTTASETGFIIERCTGATCGGTDFQPLATKPGPGATSFSDTSVCNNTTYRYQVKAYKDGLSMGGTQCWTRRKDLTVANFIPAFQMRYTVTYDSDMKADFSDLRFYDAVANIELPYWIESKTDSSTATVWIKTGTSSTIQMYFGNSAASSVSNPAQVFEFYDDFSGTSIDTTKWNIIDPNNLITQNNELIITGGGAAWGTGLYSKPSFARPFVFEIYALNPTATTYNYTNAQLGVKNAGSGINTTDFVHNMYLYWYVTPEVYIFENNNDRLHTGATLPNDVYKYFRIETLLSGAKYYYGDSLSSATKYYDSSYSTESPLKIGFAINTRNMRFDNARVRRYAAIEPSVSATGSKVILGSCPTFTGQWTSASSNIAVGPDSNPWVSTPAWVAPTGLSVTAVTDTRFNLHWTDTTSDETGFKIERCQGNGCTPVGMAPPVSVGANVTSYSDTTASASNTFCYRVKATKTASCGWDSDYSDVVCDLAFPQQTGDLTAIPLNSRAVRLTWTDVATDEDGYEVEIQAWNGMWAPIATLYGSNVTRFDHAQGLQPGRQYKYRVRPFRGTDKSPYSNVATVTTPSYETSPPTCP